VEPLTRGLPPPDPLSLCPLPSIYFADLPHRKEILGTPLLSRENSYKKICDENIIFKITVSNA
jgi:hypothetical protein